MARMLIPLGIALGAIGFAGVGIYAWWANVDSPLIPFLGLACLAVLLISGGAYSLRMGHIRSGDFTISRARHPILFYVSVLVLNFALGVTCIVLGAWLLVR